MFRKHFLVTNEGAGKHFKLRGREVTRLEGFSDAAFGFAITLLVISQSVPDTFDDLVQTMHGIVSFAICFAILFRVWYIQNLFFRRYDMQDGYTTTLNGILLLVMIFYVYPLKFLMSLIIDRFLGGGTTVKLPDGTTKAIIEGSQLPALYNYYFVGFATVSLIFVLLYHHAYLNRDIIGLEAMEVFETKADILNYLIYVGIGLLAILLMEFTKSRYFVIAIMVYTAIVVFMVMAQKRFLNRRRAALLARLANSGNFSESSLSDAVERKH